MAQEKVFVKYTRYKTHEGEPTCCLSLRDKKFCEYLYCKNYGQIDFCLLTGENVFRGEGKNGEGTGYLIPHKNCLLWGSRAKQKN